MTLTFMSRTRGPILANSVGSREFCYFQPCLGELNTRHCLLCMTLSPAVWEFFRARFASWPICLREPVSSAFEQMAHAPRRQISPERHRRFSFLCTQFSEIKDNGPSLFLTFMYSKVRASPCFSYLSAARHQLSMPGPVVLPNLLDWSRMRTEWRN